MKSSQKLQFFQSGFSFLTPAIALEVLELYVVIKDNMRYWRIRPCLLLILFFWIS